ncbi:MAG TPA: zinc ABC transporter substrate-binding protein [Anaerolineales bacterium]|nr:zinc ABC transporter substrate-binding protein [Anaerolineales bacterium]
MRPLRTILVLGALAAWSAACAPASSDQTPIDALTEVGLAPGERLQVAATTSIAADIVQAVGGEAVSLTTILAPGLDPHDYEPTFREIQNLAEMDAVFLSGLGLEAVMEQAIVDSGVQAPRISLSEGIEGPADPHVWLNPRLILTWVDNAARALSALDPTHASEYTARARAYQAQVEALDRDLEFLVNQIPPQDRKIVSEHEMLGNLADRYDLKVVGSLIPSTSSAAEPSPRDLATLQTLMDSQDVHVIVVAVSSPATLAETLAWDRGADVVRIFVESLSEAGGPADTYLRLMEYNLDAIVDALKR